MATIERFEDLDVWQNARKLTNHVYDHTRQEPFSEDFWLRDQIQRAAVSVMSNIAEGFESRTQSVFVDYLGRARGSAGEVRAQLCVALDQGYISEAEFETVYQTRRNDLPPAASTDRIPEVLPKRVPRTGGKHRLPNRP